MAPRINTAIYDLICEHGLRQPDIPVAAEPSFGQCAEDIIVAALLRGVAMREGLNLGEERYLEVGANHPVSCSATYLLARLFGMRGVLVEANPALIGDLLRFRPDDRVMHAAVVPAEQDEVEFFLSNQDELSSLDRRFVEEWRGGAVGLRSVLQVRGVTMNRLLEQEFPERAPLFLSVDVEGMDFALLESLNWQRWRPAVVQTEPSEHFTPGNTTAIAALLESKGYAVIGRTQVNLIAVECARFGLSTDAASNACTAALQAEIRRIRNRESDLEARIEILRSEQATALARSAEAAAQVKALHEELALERSRIAKATQHAAGLAPEPLTAVPEGACWRLTGAWRALRGLRPSR